jgi:DNA-binding CsgD family transcriptional regulator
VEQVRDFSRIDDWPLVGREDILAQIVQAARHPGLSGVVLVSAPGVGRTRLARETCARLARDGCRITWATATRAAASVTFGALSHLLPRATDRPGGALDMLQQFVERFGARPDRPVLVVDDAHLLDNASVALIHQLAVQRRGFLLLTLLAGAPVPDALRALWKEWLALRIHVPPLAPGHVDTLLERAFDAPLDPISRSRLRDLGAGNPQVLRELVDAGLETGMLRPVDELLHWFPGPDYVTDRLADVVDSQCGLADASLRATLEVLACAHPVDHTVVERLVDDAALVEAERRRLVAFELSGSRLTAHLTVPMYGEVIRHRMPSCRRRDIYRKLAEALAGSPRRRADDVLNMALWRLRGGLPVAGPDLLAGAKWAAARLDFVSTVELATAAQRHGVGGHAERVLADALAAHGRFAEAAAALRGAVAGWDPRDRARHDLAEARLRLWAPSAAPDRPTVLAPARGAVVAAALAWPRLLDGHVLSTVEQGRTLRPAGLPSGTAVWSTAAVIVAAGILGRTDQVDELGTAALAVATARARGLRYGFMPVHAARCVAVMLSGSLVTAAELADNGYRAALDARAEQLISVWAGLRGLVARAQGRVDMAVAALREAVVLLDRADALRLGRIWLAELAGAYGMAGDAPQARAWLARMEQYPPAPGVLLDAWVERNRAWVAGADLDLRRAAEHAIRAAGLAQATGQPMVEAAALLDAARLGAAVDVHDRLAALARDTAAEKVAVFAAMAGALARNDAHRLDTVAEVLRKLGYPLAAAEAATVAHRAHARDGRRSSGYAALSLVRELLRDCGEVRTPLLDLTGLHTDLTMRELQVARLAADGLSAGTIADRLGLSRRTVNNHLGRVYAKLGLAGRRDLADLLGVPAVAAPAG